MDCSGSPSGGPFALSGAAPDAPPRRDVLAVDGMFCAACAAGVEAVLARQHGVVRAAVNFAADAAVVEWRPQQTTLPRLLAAVRALGYRARAVGENDASAPSASAARDLGIRLAVAVFFGMWTMLPTFGLYLQVADSPGTVVLLSWSALLLSLPVVLYSGWPFYRMAVNTVRLGVPGMDAMVSFGVLGSMALSGVALARGSDHVYVEVAVALIALQLLARLVDHRVRHRAADAVRRLMELAPAVVRQLTTDGLEQEVALKELSAGSRIRVRPGERLAIDGVVHRGMAQLDRSLLTGESAAVPVESGSAVHAGELVLDGTLDVNVVHGAGRRRVDELARQVRQLLAAKPAWQRMAELAARRFLWIAAALAAFAALSALYADASAWLAAERALAVFVISCPCALALAAPLAGLRAARAAAGHGMVLRDLNAVTTAARPTLLFLDKTGTLTEGRPVVAAIHSRFGVAADALLAAAACAEQGAEHPLGRAIVAAAGKAYPVCGQTHVVPGGGVEWRDAGQCIRVGSAAWIGVDAADRPASLPSADDGASRVWVERDGQLLGAIDMRDRLRPDAAQAVADLQRAGLRVVLLSGDAAEPVRAVAQALGIAAHAQQSPEDKVRRIEQARAQGEVVAFAGDGLNDAPALAAADLGIAVGQATDAARAAAAVTLTDGGVEQLPALLALTRRARRVVRGNLVWALAYNLMAVPAAIAGYVHPAVAATAMALSSLTVVLNSARLGRLPPQSSG